MSVIELSWTAKKIVSSLLEYMVFNIMQFISNFFLGIQKVAKSVFVVVQLHFSGNSINIQQNFFYSKIGMKNLGANHPSHARVRNVGILGSITCK